MKETRYVWMQECQEVLDLLNYELVIASILIFPYWTNIFHVHVETYSFTLGVVLAYPREGNIDHPVSFVIQKLLDAERNYTISE